MEELLEMDELVYKYQEAHFYFVNILKDTMEQIKKDIMEHELNKPTYPAVSHLVEQLKRMMPLLEQQQADYKLEYEHIMKNVSTSEEVMKKVIRQYEDEKNKKRFEG